MTASKRGRPTARTPELTETICRRIAAGETLTAICRAKGMPNLATVMNWLDADREFFEHYARVREIQRAMGEDDVLDTAKSARGKSAADVQAIRLLVDTKKWVLSRTRPQKVAVDLPADMTTPAGIAAAAEAILRAACAGKITLDQATALGNLLDTRGRSIEREDLDRRVADLEASRR